MSLYSQINSFFDSKENLMKLIDIYCYARRKKENGSKAELGDIFYSELVHYGQNVSKEQHKEYNNYFEKYIYFPNCERVFSEMKNMNPYNPTLRKFRSYRELLAERERLKNLEIEKRKGKRIVYPLDNLNNQENQEYIKLLEMVKNIEGEFDHHNEEVAGFHVRREFNDNEMKVGDIKFYINGGPDIYKYAYYFNEKCKEKKLDFYYKVADPAYHEDKRTEKICFYCTFDKAEDYIKIMKEVKDEHPEIKLESPPLLAGVIGGFIGVGRDGIIKEDSSFNQDMANFCADVLDRLFGNYEIEEIIPIMSTFPSRFREVKEAFINEAAKYNIDINTMCTKVEDIHLIDDIKLVNTKTHPIFEEEPKEEPKIKTQIYDIKRSTENDSGAAKKKIIDLDDEIDELEKKVNENEKKINKYQEAIERIAKQIQDNPTLFKRYS